MTTTTSASAIEAQINRELANEYLRSIQRGPRKATTAQIIALGISKATGLPEQWHSDGSATVDGPAGQLRVSDYWNAGVLEGWDFDATQPDGAEAPHGYAYSLLAAAMVAAQWIANS